MVIKNKIVQIIVWVTSAQLFLPCLVSYAYTGETVSSSVEKSLTASTNSAVELEAGNEIAMLEQESKWEVKPGLAFQTLYDSNINREQGGSRNEDIIFKTKPSMRFVRSGGIVALDTGYIAGYERYVRDDQEPNIFSHDADMDLKINFSRLKILIGEIFTHNKTYASSEQSERRTILVNQLKGEIAYDLTDRTTAAILAQNDLFRYGETVVKDSSYLTNKYGGRVYYHWTDRYDLFVDSGYHENRYYRSTSEKNSDGFWVGSGVRGSLTSRMAVNLAAGVKSRKYSSSEYEDDYNIYAEGGLRYRMTSHIDATLLLKRDLQESISAVASSYRANSSGLEFKYKLTEFVIVKLGGFIQKNEYINNNTTAGRRAGDRSDWLTRFNTGVEWEPIEHIFLSLDYEYTNRTSTADNQDGYNRHLLTTGLAYRV